MGLTRPTLGCLVKSVVGVAGVGDGQRDLESCSCAGSVAVAQQLSVVCLNDRLGDGQPDAASGAVGGAGRVAPVEALEQLVSYGGVEPFTVVGHCDPAPVVVSGGGDRHDAPSVGVSQSIVQQCAQSLG